MFRARVKVTGEILDDVTPEDSSYADPGYLDMRNGKFYKPDELEILYDFDEPDWGLFRREAAKVILAGMVHGNAGYVPNQATVKQAVSIALRYTDELIRQLKGEEDD